jgi:hypothetical protein
VMVLPPEAGTTSPLMNNPSGCSYFCPLGAVIFLNNDISYCALVLVVANWRKCRTGNCWPGSVMRVDNMSWCLYQRRRG